MSWVVKDEGYSKDNIANAGNKFLTGNGYMGYRGTLEEFKSDSLVSCNLLGIYDKQGDKWREPINAPNGLYTTLFCGDNEISLQCCEPKEHSQSLDIKAGIHSRETVYSVSNGNITVSAERFISLCDIHGIALKYTVTADKACELVIKTGIDSAVWDINGPHFESIKAETKDGVISVLATTGELKAKVAVAEKISADFSLNESVEQDNGSIFRVIKLSAEANKAYTITKFVAVYTTNDVDETKQSAIENVNKAFAAGYDACKNAHIAAWAERWANADVVIEGDDEAQFALRYSIYHLEIIAPQHSDKVSIPARGLSGQTYKGAIFWDTEMFMLPFYLHTDIKTALNLVKYRVHTLGGARRKAAEYGYRGAYYAWESQEEGDDACSHFNVTDVFTNRPMRTYFRDKQIHISADVAYGIWQTYLFLGDESILIDGGAEVILECARFFYSYAYFKEDKDRYEILDITGPDEYHERVNNNIYTSRMIANTFEVAIKAIDLLKTKYPEEYKKLITKLDYEKEIDNIKHINAKLYVPQPDPETGIIEQFDGYYKLEDCSLSDVKSRILDPKEYWGGANGIAANTMIIKQADVVLTLNVFKNDYSTEIKQKNWEYYEPRTEHGSSLSPCIYALVACEFGNQDWGYKYFLKSATVDLTGESKQFAGLIYIGGTHPAASGGAWMVAVLGYAGLKIIDGKVTVTPKLPKQWNRLKFNITYRGEKYLIDITKEESKVCKI